MTIWFTAIIAVLLFLLLIPSVCWFRIYVGKERDDRFAGKTAQERRRNWKLMTTLALATVIPMFPVFALVSDLGYGLAVSFRIPTEGAEANLWYALGYLFLVNLPAMALAGVAGRRLWKRFARRHYPEKLLNDLLRDIWWARSGGD